MKQAFYWLVCAIAVIALSVFYFTARNRRCGVCFRGWAVFEGYRCRRHRKNRWWR